MSYIRASPLLSSLIPDTSGPVSELQAYTNHLGKENFDFESYVKCNMAILNFLHVHWLL